MCLLLPWGLINGELLTVLSSPYSPQEWTLIWGAAALGGVRALSQILVLNVASATTLSVSNLGIQALTISISFPIFGTEPTNYLIAGIAVTWLGSALYAYIKTGFKAIPKPYMSAIAWMCISCGGVAFSYACRSVQTVVLLVLGAALVAAKLSFRATAGRRWAEQLRLVAAEDKALAAAGGLFGEPSWLQRSFRMFYLSQQEEPPAARALVWYGLCALGVGLLLYPFGKEGDAQSLLAWSYESVSMVKLGVQMTHRLENPLSWTVLALCVYRLHSTVFLWCTPLARKPGEKGEPAWVNDPSYLKRIGAVIPCHQSAAEIGETITSIMRYLPPENIVVVDNANSETPLDDTEAVVRAIHPAVQYVYVSKGLKSLALWTGLNKLPQHVGYVMHMDDDTKLTDDMVFDESWFLRNPSISEVTYPVFTRRVNLLTDAIGLIFKHNAHLSRFHNATSGTSLWAPGIIGIVRREVLVGVLRDHVFLPFGEDAFHGLLQLMNGYKIQRETRSNVVTFAPPVLTNTTAHLLGAASSVRTQGYGAATLFKQRAQRWNVTKLRRMGWTLILVLFWKGGSLWHNVWFRLTYAHQVRDTPRLPVRPPRPVKYALPSAHPSQICTGRGSPFRSSSVPSSPSTFFLSRSSTSSWTCSRHTSTHSCPTGSSRASSESTFSKGWRSTSGCSCSTSASSTTGCGGTGPTSRSAGALCSHGLSCTTSSMCAKWSATPSRSSTGSHSCRHACGPSRTGS